MSIIRGLYVTIRIIHKRYYSTQIAVQFDTAYLRSALYIVMQKAVTLIHTVLCDSVWQNGEWRSALLEGEVLFWERA